MLERLLRESAGAIADGRGPRSRSRRPRFGVIAARGSSDNAARYAQHLFGRFWGMPVALATPSLHTLYDARWTIATRSCSGSRSPARRPTWRAVVAAATAQGAITVAITNEPDSALGRGGAARDRPLHRARALRRGDQDLHGVARRRRRAGRRRRRGAGRDARTRWRASSSATCRAEWPQAGGDSRSSAAAWPTGRRSRPRLKLSELTGMVAAPWSSADFLHGPIAIVEPGFPILAIAPSGPTLAGMRELLEAARARGAETTVITDDVYRSGARGGSRSSRCRSGSARSSPSSPRSSSPSGRPSTSVATWTARSGLKKVTRTS